MTNQPKLPILLPVSGAQSGQKYHQMLLKTLTLYLYSIKEQWSNLIFNMYFITFILFYFYIKIFLIYFTFLTCLLLLNKFKYTTPQAFSFNYHCVQIKFIYLSIKTI